MYLVMGVSKEEFMESCPKELRPYEIAYRMKQEEIDINNWNLGKYVLSATTYAVEHCLSGDKAKSKYFEKPLFKLYEEENKNNNLTEEEKKKQTELFFMQLQIMEQNFNLQNKYD